MLRYCIGNIFTSNKQWLVCPVNCNGSIERNSLMNDFMGLFPELWGVYREFSVHGGIKKGKSLYIHHACFIDKKTHKDIILFPVRDSVNDEITEEYIEAGLVSFVDFYKKRGVSSVAFPNLFRKAAKEIIKRLFDKHIKELDIDTDVYIAEIVK